MDRKVIYEVTVLSETCTVEDIQFAIEQAGKSGASESSMVTTSEVGGRYKWQILVGWHRVEPRREDGTP